MERRKYREKIEVWKESRRENWEGERRETGESQWEWEGVKKKTSRWIVQENKMKNVFVEDKSEGESMKIEEEGVEKEQTKKNKAYGKEREYQERKMKREVEESRRER